MKNLLESWPRIYFVGRRETIKSVVDEVKSGNFNVHHGTVEIRVLIIDLIS